MITAELSPVESMPELKYRAVLMAGDMPLDVRYASDRSQLSEWIDRVLKASPDNRVEVYLTTEMKVETFGNDSH